MFHHLQKSIKIVSTLEDRMKMLEKYIKIRRWWTKPHLVHRMRERYGAYQTVFMYFKLSDHEEFYSFIGMTVDEFEKINELTRPFLIKHSIRRALCPEMRLAIVLQ